jgi:alpha-amylase/alpha-mannosidase (GH57 family)
MGARHNEVVVSGRFDRRMRATNQYVCVYGHFYQPPREDPFTGEVPHEFGAGHYDNFNEKITAECYRPNALAGVFERISFDLGPTLASWLAEHHPDIHQRMVDADRRHRERYGVGNALAQAYNHTILPLATPRDKYTQIQWGLTDFAHRFGHPADGLWLAETAVDLETLDLAAAAGVRYTVLAPWQAAEPIDPTEPYRVRLPSGREITVFFYNGHLSGAVSFDPETTRNADRFASSTLPPQVNQEKRARGEAQIITIATDGELYGHHKSFRDHFLSRLLEQSAAANGFEIVTLARYLTLRRPTRAMTLNTPSAWSCAHGVARWGAGCSCTEGDSSWKPTLRHALDRLAERLNALFERETAGVLHDPWAARDDYLALRNGWMTQDAFWSRHGAKWRWFRNRPQEARTRRLLEAQYFGQAMYTSCGFFFADLDRIEPRNDIAYARKAISEVWQTTGDDLQARFVADLKRARSPHSGATGADLYRLLPSRPSGELPPLADTTDEPAA